MNTNNSKQTDITFLKNNADYLRRQIFRIVTTSGAGHIAGALSTVELLTVLYANILNITPSEIKNPLRDRFVLSKGHSAVALYCVLEQYGFISAETLNTFGKNGTILGGHPDMYKVPGVEASTGSLGHGLPFAVGLALAAKIDRLKYRVFVLLGDGESQEGSIWEAAMFAAQKQLDNLIAITDYNKLQAMDKLNNIVDLAPLADKWTAFGWAVKEIDGHNIQEILDTLSNLPLKPNQPTMIIAHTIKGKGIPFMENTPIWHYRQPNQEEYKIAAQSLGLVTD